MIKIIEKTSQYHKHTNNHSHVKLQSGFKANYKTTSNSTYHHSSFRTSEYRLRYLVQKRRPIENGVIPPLKENEKTIIIMTKHNSKQDRNSTTSI